MGGGGWYLSFMQRRRQTEKMGRRQPLNTWATRIIIIRSTASFEYTTNPIILAKIQVGGIPLVLMTVAATPTITRLIPCFIQATLLLLASSPSPPSSPSAVGRKNMEEAVAVAPRGVASCELGWCVRGGGEEEERRRRKGEKNGKKRRPT